MSRSRRGRKNKRLEVVNSFENPNFNSILCNQQWHQFQTEFVAGHNIILNDDNQLHHQPAGNDDNNNNLMLSEDPNLVLNDCYPLFIFDTNYIIF
ncbi:1519_t:CDS:2 [Entrophospora sp. SA101]|nr:12640_t:CDS:2 [Entrophospora sp. SA101]CAJ0760220.1 1519_t:CDS:2 [Entrophospora sp. SA101]CAJ0916841.1 14231_t:CDS:2 [Entrophospora sp. SA101]